MNIKLIVTENCSTCRRTAKQLKDFVHGRKDVNLLVTADCDDSPVPIFIFPALFVEDELFSYGEVNLDKLDNFLNLNQQRLSA